MAKKKTKAPAKARATKKSTGSTQEQALRDHLLFLLKDGGAHIGVDDALANWPLQSAGVKVAKFPHTAWMLLEHMRLAQLDILEFSLSPKHVSPKWPEGYWPESGAPADENAWKDSVAAFKKDLRAMQQMVASHATDLFARISWGDGQTILRETLLVADHNAYHLGQLVMLRKSLGL